MTGSIGDRVFNDLNQNGIQEAGEPGVPNVLVQLKNCFNNDVLETTFTNGSGNYSFGNLTSGCYRIGIDVPNGFVVSPQNATNDANDSDIDPIMAMSGNINLAPGENDPTNDAGIYQPVQPTGSIGDRVFNDLNQNGVQEAGEPGVPNVPVQLKDCFNNVLETTFTNGNGNYSFTGLADGCYRIGITVPNGFVVSPQNATNDANDSDIDPVMAMTGNINLDPGEDDPNNDAGIYEPVGAVGSIGDRVFNDLNGDGVQNAGEPGVPNVPVQLKDCFNNILQTTFTNGNGNYGFGGLDAGCYRIGITVPNGFVVSPQNATVDTNDSDIDPDTEMTGNINLGAGENDPDNDAGIFEPQQPNGSIGDLVFNDLDQDGVQDSGEPGVPNIPVQLKDCNNNVIDATVTNANGRYEFDDLAAGCYRIGVVVPSDFVVSPPNQTDDANDSDINPGNAMTGNITLGPGEDDPTNDAGIYQPVQPTDGALGDKVFFDENGNGQQDSGEPGIENAFVMLMTCGGAFVDFAFTDANGNYLFDELDAGCYKLFFANPNGSIYMQTTQDSGDDVTDSDGDAGGDTDDINLAQGEVNLTIDNGFKPMGGPVLGSIGDLVFNDLDQDGVQDAGEPGVPNIPVQLKDCSNNVIDATVTDGNGRYEFDDLTAGCYRIGIVVPSDFVVSPQDATGDANDSDINPGTAMTGDINLGSGEDDPTNDAGIYQPQQPTGSIGDLVFNDLDEDGVQDAGEPGVPNIPVQLKDCNNNVLDATVTDGNGRYEFDGLTAGCYRIGIVVPNDFFVSPKDATNDDDDSDINPGTAMSDDINIAPGEDDDSNDAGIFQDAGGDPCAAISVSASSGKVNVTGANAPIVTIQVFDDQWATVFNCGSATDCPNPANIDLPSGDYCVSVKLYTASWSPICEVFECVTVPGGGNPGSIGDKVFNDVNQNGVQDPSEPGINGVTVQLKNCNGAVIATTVTAGNGGYSFSNLDPGCYRISVVLPNGFQFTTPNIGDDGSDSDINPANGQSGNIGLAAGENDDSNDAGLISQSGCDNITFGGKIGFGGSCAGSHEICDANGGAAPVIGSCQAPSGGSGVMEIIWLKNEFNCDPIGVTVQDLLNDPSVSPWKIVPGATGMTLDPGFVGSTTCYQRCVRRAGCTVYSGESNIVQIAVNPNCGGSGDPDCGNIGISASVGNINVSGLNGAPVVSVQVWTMGWQPVYSCFGDCGSSNIANIPAASGSYRVKVKYNDDNWSPICEVNEVVNVVNALISAGSQFDFEAVKHDEHAELIWMHDQSDLVESYVIERSYDDQSYVEITTVSSKGGVSLETYQGFDLAPAIGDNFYRIRMDLSNGTSAYSNIRVVNYADLIDFVLFPNPANDFVKLNLETVVGKQATVIIYNNLGVTVQKYQLGQVSGKYHQIDLRDMREGHYIVRLYVPEHKPVSKTLMIGKL